MKVLYCVSNIIFILTCPIWLSLLGVVAIGALLYAFVKNVPGFRRDLSEKPFWKVISAH